MICRFALFPMKIKVLDNMNVWYISGYLNSLFIMLSYKYINKYKYFRYIKQ